LGYRTVKKNYDNMLSHFHAIPERNGRKDRQPNGQTDRFAVSLSRVSMLTRDKKRSVLLCYQSVTPTFTE